MSVKDKSIVLDLDSAFRNRKHSLSLRRLRSIGTKTSIANLRLAKTTASWYGDTVLHLACRNGWLDVAKLLVEEYGFAPDIRDREMWTPLHYACRYGHLGIAQYLISNQQCDVTATTSNHWTPLHFACRYGYMSIVEYLAGQMNVLQSVDQSSLLHLTCEYGQSNILIYLMNKKGFTHNPNSEKVPDHGLLLTACHHNHIVIVQHLLKDVTNYQDIEFEECQALFMFCCKNGLLDVLKQLTLKVCEVSQTIDSSGKSGIHYACHNGHTAIVQHLVEECDSNINVPDKDGFTPLHIACKYGQNVDSVKYILSRPECDVSALTHDGSTVLHCASMTEEFDSHLINILVTNGATLSKGTQCHIQTMRCSNLEAKLKEPTVKSAIVSCLLSQVDVAKCNPNIRNYPGFSPVHVSTYPFIVREILACHAQTGIYKWIKNDREYYALFEIKRCVGTGELDLNETASNGDSVLHMACAANKPQIARYLLNECNFDPNVKNNTEDTPLGLALKFYTYRMLPKCNLLCLVSVFIKNARWNPALADKDGDGNTLLHLACLSNQHKLISALQDIDGNLEFSRNNDGYMPFELLSNPKLTVNYALKGTFIYTFKPGTVHQFIWFCKKMEHGQLERIILNKHSNTIKWEHNATINCQIGRYMLYLPSHQIWLLMKVCFHSYSSIQKKETYTKDCKHIFVIDIIDHLKDSKYTGSESNEALLCIASKRNRYHFVEHLILALKCTPNCFVSKRTLIELTNDSNIMQLLIQHGARIKSSDIDKLFVISAMTNKIIHPNTFRTLKDTGQWYPDLVCNSKGDTALHLSARHHRYDVAVYFLTEANCDPNMKNRNGEKPFHLLMSTKSWSDSECICIIKALMSTRAWNPNSSCNYNGDTAFHLSAWYHRYEVAHYLLSEEMCDPKIMNLNGIQPIQMLLSTNSWSDPECIEIIKALMTSGIWDPNSSCNSNNDTVLHISAKLHRYKVAYYLISEAKCDPKIRNREGDQAIGVLMTAKQWLGKSWSVKSQSANSWSDPECINMIKVMISTGLWDHNSICSSKGDTILHLSARHHRCDLMYMLLSEIKCDPNIKNKKGETCMQQLISRDEWTDTECIKILKVMTSTSLDSSCNSKGDTALHLSTRYRRYKVTHYLLSEAKCDPNIRNVDDKTLVQLLLPFIIRNWLDTKCIDLIKALISTKKWDPNCSCDSNGDTALHLSTRHHRPTIVHFLLSQTPCNPNVTNNVGETPLQVVSNSTSSIINDLIRHGANPDNVYKSFGKSVGLTKPLVPPVKVFIIGNSGVGKSTLTEALKIETSFLVRRRSRSRVSSVNEKTAGIIPHEFESKLYGSVIFYDFAGHKEFYNSHIAILQNVIKSSSPIFLIVVNFNNSKEEIQHNIQVWLSFIDDNCTVTHCKPHIIIIGSHADIALNRGEDPNLTVSQMTNNIQEISQDMALEYIGMYPIDCRYPESASMAELRSCLNNSCKSLRISDTISFNTHCFHVFLLDKFRKSVAVTINTLQMEIEKTTNNKEKGVVNYLPDSASALSLVCDELNDRGHILFLKKLDNLEKSWVIIDKAALLSNVTGTIFAPNDFKEHCQIAESTGVVPLSRLTETFPEYKSELLIGVLTHLEYCHEINDDELQELISKHREGLNNTNTTESGKNCYFLFPGLITLNAPKGLWKQNHILKYHCFWTMNCCHQTQFFSSRFTQVLLLRLAFTFSLIKKEVNPSIPALQRECSIWKNGIFWGEIFGMEIIVEIYSKKVILLMRCQQENLIHSIAQRSSIIQKIIHCAHDFCSNIKTVESFINPSEAIEFPLKSPVSSETPQFSLQKIAEAIVKSTDYDSPTVVSSIGTISLDYLLIFEPYAELGMAALKLYYTCGSDGEKVISDDFLELLSHKFIKKATLFIEIFKSRSALSHLSSSTSEDLFTLLQTWRDECNGTYKCLKQKLDQFSVFAGKDILVSYCFSSIINSHKHCMIMHHVYLLYVISIKRCTR